LTFISYVIYIDRLLTTLYQLGEACITANWNSHFWRRWLIVRSAVCENDRDHRKRKRYFADMTNGSMIFNRDQSRLAQFVYEIFRNFKHWWMRTSERCSPIVRCWCINDNRPTNLNRVVLLHHDYASRCITWTLRATVMLYIMDLRFLTHIFEIRYTWEIYVYVQICNKQAYLHTARTHIYTFYFFL